GFKSHRHRHFEAGFSLIRSAGAGLSSVRCGSVVGTAWSGIFFVAWVSELDLSEPHSARPSAVEQFLEIVRAHELPTESHVGEMPTVSDSSPDYTHRISGWLGVADLTSGPNGSASHCYWGGIARHEVARPVRVTSEVPVR
ncbi:hypothetical protein, partial [Microbacterium sp. CJ77]|uniref:hypothetical protein n=1 Tax=Microbacterium sp. CJ77 TaxID=2079201 RepID=UPI001CA53BE0